MTTPPRREPADRALTRGAAIAIAALLALLAVFAAMAPGQDAGHAGAERATEAAGPVPSYAEDIQPIFNARCITCHGCLGSPCNVRLTSFRGVDRGGYGKNPYASHVGDYRRTGMNVAQTTSEWRERGFYPVLSRGNDPAENRARSMLYQVIEAGAAHNKPGFSREALAPLYAERYAHQCPATPDTLRAYLDRHPQAGMPFGLPALSENEMATLRAWVGAGSPGPTEADRRDAQTVTSPEAVLSWERFFNEADQRSQLVARYIFDHVFLATIVLDESPGDYFKLVRSKTPPGSAEQNPPAAIEVIDAPLPYSDPYAYAGVKRFYYRLQKITDPIVQKNHFVWRLAIADIDRLKALFLTPDWDENARLDAPWDVGNPFLVYDAIPTESRYRFLLENAELIVSGITYGPVCLGQTATFAVKDQFWVYFVDPAYDVSVREPKLGLETWDAFMDRSLFGNDEYEAAYAAALKKLRPRGYTIDAVWNGGRTNPNAWLTVLRHETNVSVMKGRQGGIPRTMWLMDYSGFERIYYDTVASFEYWSGDARKLQTLVFFNYLRQEFEDNFLLLLPEDDRQPIRDDWTQGIGQAALALEPFAGDDQPTQVRTDKRDPLLSLVADIQAHMGEAVSGPPDLLNPRIKPDVSFDDAIETYDDWIAAASQLTQTRSYEFPRYLPSVVLLKLTSGKEARVFSLIANRVYASQDTIFFQNGQELPDLYTMSIYPTIVGGFPNYFFEMDLSEASDFLRGLRDVRSLTDWNRLRNRYGVLRNDERFWETYDWFTQWNVQNRGVEAGTLDLSYYDLFDSIY